MRQETSHVNEVATLYLENERNPVHLKVSMQNVHFEGSGHNLREVDDF